MPTPTYNGKDFKTTTGPDGLPMSSVVEAVASDGSPIYSQAVSITKGTAGNKNLYAAAVTRNSATWLTTTSLTFKYGVS